MKNILNSFRKMHRFRKFFKSKKRRVSTYTIGVGIGSSILFNVHSKKNLGLSITDYPSYLKEGLFPLYKSFFPEGYEVFDFKTWKRLFF